MPEDTISFRGNELTVGNLTWRVPYQIQQAALVEGRVIVLYDYMAGPASEHFPNLEAFSPAGTKLWVAEHPLKTVADSYESMSISDDPSVISANSFACFRCRIESTTGHLIDAEFTK